jgi:N-acetylmuramoyl-L-alanine amidase
MSSIAAQYGFANWKTIYEHPSNAALRKARPNPNLLHPGDELFVPDLAQKSESCATEARHRFQVKRAAAKLRVVLCDDRDKPLADKRYVIRGDGIEREGRTDGEGLVEESIPPHLDSAELLVWQDEDGEGPPGRYPLRLGHLDPTDTPSGVQARLHNLGYRCPASGGTPEETRAAVRAFRREHGLKESDAIDDEFRERLRREHDGG